MDPDAPSTSAVTPVTRIIFDENKADFRQAVDWEGFVDRTLLIKALLDKPRCVIIFAPKRFGKSLNMDMVKRFFEIEKGRNVSKAPEDLTELESYDNYQAFHRYGQGSCEIMKEENRVLEMKKKGKLVKEDIVKKYFGRHPVLHLDFKNVLVTKESSPADVKHSLRDIVQKAYHQHFCRRNDIIYHIHSAPIKDEFAQDMCKSWLDRKLYKEEDPTVGLQYLIEFLHAHHGRKVYVLVDEFDAPAVNALLAYKSRDDVTDISNVITSLLGAVVKGKIAEDHLLGSLITGVSYLGSIGISTHLNNIPAYKWLSSDDEYRFAYYYCLGEGDLQRILEKVFSGQERKQTELKKKIDDLYNGYDWKDSDGEKKRGYCLWSVLHYIRACLTKEPLQIKKTAFWAGSAIITRLGKVLKNADVLERMIGIASNQAFLFKPTEKVDAADLAQVLAGSKTSDAETVYSFLLEQGYLVPSSEPGHGGEEIAAKCPNLEVMDAVKDMFRNYCEVICGVSNSAMRNCASFVKTMFGSCTWSQYSDKKFWEDFYTNLETMFSNLQERTVIKKRVVQAVMWTAMLKAGLEECSIEKRVDKGDQYGFMDLWLRDGASASIWELKCVREDGDDFVSTKASARKGMEEIVDGTNKNFAYSTILRTDDGKKRYERYVLVGLALGPQCKPCIQCLVCDGDDRKTEFSFPG